MGHPPMTPINLVTILPGAVAFKEGNVNETYRGQVLLADGSVQMAIIKDLDARQLANELLVAVLGRRLGLPVPDVHLGLVRAGDLNVTKGPTFPDGGRLVFVSRDAGANNIAFFLQSATITEALRQKVQADMRAWADLGRLYAFDAWVANIDRHPGNLLFAGQDQIWLIDHGHCFSGPAWTPAHLDPNASFPHRLSEWISRWLTIEEKRARSSEAAGFVRTMAAMDVSGATRDSWIASLLPDPEVSAVEAFLAARLASVARHANTALGMPSLI